LDCGGRDAALAVRDTALDFRQGTTPQGKAPLIAAHSKALLLGADFGVCLTSRYRMALISAFRRFDVLIFL